AQAMKTAEQLAAIDAALASARSAAFNEFRATGDLDAYTAAVRLADEVHRTATAAIDGTIKAIVDANKAIADFTDAAELGGLDARTRSLTMLAREYNEVRTAAEAAGKTQAELAAIDAAYVAQQAQINALHDQRAAGDANAASAYQAFAQTM